MDKEQKCSNCSNTFTLTNTARILPICSHNICTNCLKQFIKTKITSFYCKSCERYCPFEEDDLQSFPKNISILKKIKEITQNNCKSHVSSDKANSVETENSLLITKSQSHMVQMCQIHEKPLEIICTDDKILLCSHCGLFGEHRTHALKTLKQFQEDMENLRNNFHILKERKAASDNSIQGKQYHLSIRNHLNKKKNSLIQEIRQHFQHLINIVKQAQARIYDELAEAFIKIDTNINKITKQEHFLQQNFLTWFQHAQNFLHSINSSKDIKYKIQNLYELDAMEGNLRMKDIEKKNQSVKNVVTKMIESIHIEYSQSLDGYVYNYAKVFSQIPDLDNVLPFSANSDKYEQNYKKPAKPQFVKSDIILNPMFQQPDRINNKNNINRKSLKSPTRYLSPTSNHFKQQQQVITNAGRKSLKNPQMSPHKKDKQLPQNYDFAQRNLNQFKKNTQTLDLTGCDLNDNQIYHVISLAAQHKPIKCLKMSKNKLTNSGVSKILQFIEFATNINCQYNLLTEDAVDQFIQHRQLLPNLRIINFSHNKLNQRKVKCKIDELKRMGIIAKV